MNSERPGLLGGAVGPGGGAERVGEVHEGHRLLRSRSRASPSSRPPRAAAGTSGPGTAWLSGVGGPGQQLLEEFARGAAGKRRDTGEQLVGDDRQRIDVGLLADELAAQGLGGHVLQACRRRTRRASAALRAAARRPARCRSPAAGRCWVAGSYMMLAGFRSRWMIPAPCACGEGGPSCSTMSAATGGASLWSGPERLQRLAGGPFQRQVVHAVGLAEVEGAHHVRMDHPGPELGLAQEALDRDRVLARRGRSTFSAIVPRSGCSAR